jgi:TRAP-type C4-dicarboxylate transport system permease small subunit
MLLKIGNFLRRVLFVVGHRAIAAMGFVLILMVLLTVVDVTLRRVFNSPLEFSLELMQIGLVVAVWGAVLYSTGQERHISITVLTDRFPAKTRRFLSVVFDLVSALLLLLIGWRSVIYGMTLARMGQETPVLEILIFPFVFILAFGAIWAGLMLLVNFIDSVRGKAEP